MANHPDMRSNKGFTLIELLVVIIIIGVLASIAIPTFMRHRGRAFDVAVESDLRNAALAQDAFLTDGTSAGHWAATIDELRALGFRPSSARIYYGGVFSMVIGGDAESFCLTARSASGRYLGFGSATGGVISDAPLDQDSCSG